MLYVYLGAYHHALRYIWGSLYKKFGTRTALAEKIKPTTKVRAGEVLYMSRFFCKNSFWVDGYVELGKFKKGTGLPFSDTSCVNISFVDWGKKRSCGETCVLLQITALSTGVLGLCEKILSHYFFVLNPLWEIDTRLFLTIICGETTDWTPIGQRYFTHGHVGLSAETVVKHWR